MDVVRLMEQRWIALRGAQLAVYAAMRGDVLVDEQCVRRLLTDAQTEVDEACVAAAHPCTNRGRAGRSNARRMDCTADTR